MCRGAVRATRTRMSTYTNIQLHVVFSTKDREPIITPEVTGKETDSLEAASADFVLRYWRSAKDSATRRVNTLVQKALPAGSDPTKLP